MHRVSRKVVLAAIGALALATLVSPAGAHNGKGGGKKALGTIASFDGTTLTVTTADGNVTATVTEDTKVKVEHRGHFAKGKDSGKGRGNPSRGDAEDLVAGTFVLDMKVDDEGNLDRIRVRSAAPHETEPTATPAPTDTPTETPAPEVTETPAPVLTPAPTA